MADELVLSTHDSHVPEQCPCTSSVAAFAHHPVDQDASHNCTRSVLHRMIHKTSTWIMEHHEGPRAFPLWCCGRVAGVMGAVHSASISNGEGPGNTEQTTGLCFAREAAKRAATLLRPQAGTRTIRDCFWGLGRDAVLWV